MSGRSAYVRKEKSRVKDVGLGQPSDADSFGNDKATSSLSSINDFSMSGNTPQRYHPELNNMRTANEYTHAKTGTGPLEDSAYARVRRPQLPSLDVSGIEKSSFRSLMDKKSEGVRKGIAKTFGMRKKPEDIRPPSAAAGAAAVVRSGSHELDAGEYTFHPAASTPRQQQQFEEQVEIRPPPPQGKLPAIPPGARSHQQIQQGDQLKRWLGSGKGSQPWNKLRKDPELWDHNGDTLVFFSHESQQASRPPPSFRISSHVIEQTDSRFLITLLREGMIDGSQPSMPPSPVHSPHLSSAHPGQANQYQLTPPLSENSANYYDGQISYEIYFPPPYGQSEADKQRHKIATRNVFALLYQASFVGTHMFEALKDLHDRLAAYLPPDTDAAGLVVDYLTSKGIDDVRNDPAAATSLLAWCESFSIRWEEGWRESYVHCAGMANQLESCHDFRHVSPITKALLERAGLGVTVRVHEAGHRLATFNFEDIWAVSTPSLSTRGAFDRLRTFFKQHYQKSYHAWPPPGAVEGSGQWLIRPLAQELQQDFGALYDYLVNREVVWDCSEERSGRKWNLIQPGNKAFEADDADLAFTDVIVAYDNKRKIPHIPRPYPLTPDPAPGRAASPKENSAYKTNRKGIRFEDKMAEKIAALAYTEATNIYLLGSSFATNSLVDAFIKFEKADMAGDVDPYAARRGRWVLIYAILQELARISVDTPHLRYSEGVSYYLNATLKGTPPWKGTNPHVIEADHTGSYCWTARERWLEHAADATPPPNFKPHMKFPAPPSFHESELLGGTIRSPTMGSVRSPTMMTGSSTRSRRVRSSRDPDSSYSSFAPGIEKVNDWSGRERTHAMQSPVNGRAQTPYSQGTPARHRDLTITDFDNSDYQF